MKAGRGVKGQRELRGKRDRGGKGSNWSKEDKGYKGGKWRKGSKVGKRYKGCDGNSKLGFGVPTTCDYELQYTGEGSERVKGAREAKGTKGVKG